MPWEASDSYTKRMNSIFSEISFLNIFRMHLIQNDKKKNKLFNALGFERLSDFNAIKTSVMRNNE